MEHVTQYNSAARSCVFDCFGITMDNSVTQRKRCLHRQYLSGGWICCWCLNGICWHVENIETSAHLAKCFIEREYMLPLKEILENLENLGNMGNWKCLNLYSLCKFLYSTLMNKLRSTVCMCVSVSSDYALNLKTWGTGKVLEFGVKEGVGTLVTKLLFDLKKKTTPAYENAGYWSSLILYEKKSVFVKYV